MRYAAGRSFVALVKRLRARRVRPGESLAHALITEGSEALITTEDGENLITEDGREG